MTLKITFALLACMLCGCASEHDGVALSPVGPQPSQASDPTRHGSLVVFSAADSTPDFYSNLYHTHYTDYRLLSADGKLLRTIHNDSGSNITGPTVVPLPAGNYRVVARANGYGTVTIPVVIESHHTTTIHLEGGLASRQDSGFAGRKPVQLPNGDIVGWSPSQETVPNN